MPSLEVLTLNRNMLTSADALTKAIASGEAPQLRRLLLQHNRISDQSLRELQTTVNASMLKAPQPTHAERPRAPHCGLPGGDVAHQRARARRADHRRAPTLPPRPASASIDAKVRTKRAKKDQARRRGKRRNDL